jgi:hypothetical protein
MLTDARGRRVDFCNTVIIMTSNVGAAEILEPRRLGFSSAPDEAAEYEQMFDLATVREAAEAAGMSKPSASQICYLDLTGGDHAVVYQKEASSALSHVLTSVNYGVGAVVEYFR